jgi:hypothetical protein
LILGSVRVSLSSRIFFDINLNSVISQSYSINSSISEPRHICVQNAAQIRGISYIDKLMRREEKITSGFGLALPASSLKNYHYPGAKRRFRMGWLKLEGETKIVFCGGKLIFQIFFLFKSIS